MRLHEAWQLEYEQRRYLRYASTPEIQERIFDIMNNNRTLTADNKIGFLAPDAGGRFWMSRMSHVQAEMRLRRSGLPPMPPQFADELKGVTDPIPEVEKWLAARGLQPGSYLIKFSKRQWNEDALRLGRIKISSASSLDNSGFRRAIRDCERLRITYALPEEVQLTDPAGNPIRSGGRVEFKHELLTDYFVYCVAMAHERRLFHDFGADSCLIIHNVNEFADRLINAVLSVHPGYTVSGKNIQYFDPFNTLGNLDVVFMKPFGYAYQKEYRLAWLPPKPESKLDPFFVNLGSLQDIAELVC